MPGYQGGGPVTSIANLVRLIDDNFSITIVTSNCDFGNTKPYDNVEIDKITKYDEFNVIYLSKINNKSIMKVIREIDPDIIYLNSFFSKTTQLVMFLNKKYFNKKIIVAPRGELQDNALKIKKFKKRIYLFLYKLFSLFKNIHFHSTDQIETIQLKKLFSVANIIEVQNAVALKRCQPLQKKENELKLIFVSRIAVKKNLDFALNMLSKVKVNVLFDIYGPKEDQSYWKKCENIIKSLPQNLKVRYKGSLKQNETVDTMRQYNAFLFPTKSENFGHVIVEAMQAGVLPVISNQTPWTGLDKKNAGWDIDLENESKYIEIIESLYYMDNIKYSKLSKDTIEYINEKLNTDKLKQQYVNFFNSVMDDK